MVSEKETWDYPKLEIEPPPGASSEGLPEVPHGMLAWKNKNNGHVILACGYYSDPEATTKHWWELATGGLSWSDICREYLISFTTRGGSKCFPYLEHHPEKFLVSHKYYRDGNEWKIPKNWRIVAGLDFGSRNPTSIHFYGIDPGGRWHSFWEFFKPSNPTEIAEVLLSHPLYDRVEYIAADPSIWKKDQQLKTMARDLEKGEPLRKSIGDLIQEEGIDKLVKGDNDRASGLTRVEKLFNQRPEEPDRESMLVFSDDCPEQWREFKALIYEKETDAQLQTRNASEKAEKKDDHSFDDTRYTTSIDGLPGEVDFHPGETEFSLSRIEREMDEEDFDRELNELF